MGRRFGPKSWSPPMIDAFRADIPHLGRVLFRVDAGKVAGLSFGHLERCAVLSRLLLRAGAEATTFLMRTMQGGLARARALGLEVALPSRWPEALAGGDVLVVDLPFPPEEQVMRAARQAGAYLALLDDTGRDLFPCDLVLNSSVLAEKSMYPRARKTLLGPAYCILDERYAAARHHGSDDAGPPVVLLTFGGSDPTGLTARVLRALGTLAGTAPACRLRVVLGPGFGDATKVEQAREKLSLASELHVSPEDMLPLFTGCDLAICAGGRTLYELRALGTPTLALASAPHEARQIDAFLRRGLLQCGVTRWSENEFLNKFKMMLSGQTRRATSEET